METGLIWHPVDLMRAILGALNSYPGLFTNRIQDRSFPRGLKRKQVCRWNSLMAAIMTLLARSANDWKKKKEKDKIILINKQTGTAKSIFVQLGSYWKSLYCWNVFRNFKQIKLMMMTEKDCGQYDRVSERLHIKKLHGSEVIKRLEWETLLFIDIVCLSGMHSFDGHRMDICGEKVRNRRNDHCSARTRLIEMHINKTYDSPL